MKAFLKGCSEMVDFETKTVRHFLKFEMENGTQFEIPSTEEATHDLVKFLAGGKPQETPKPAEEPTVDDVEEFGGDGGLEDPPPENPEEVDANPSFEVHDQTEGPPAESDVPSL